VTSRLRLLVADDHTIVRQGLRKILEGQPGWLVEAEAADGREAVAAYSLHMPDVAILDIGMPILNGIEASREILGRHSGARILILSMHVHRAYAAQAIRAGARGYLSKDAADDDLIRALAAIAGGKAFLSPALSQMMLDDYRPPGPLSAAKDPFETLSEREREVLQHVAEGRNTRHIAERLGIRAATVETHRARLMDKLDIHNVAELVLYAARRGLVS
jgi:two-component system response regulator NreC